MAAVADLVRLDMLVGPRVLGDRRGMDAGLGGEGAGADIGRLAVGRAVDQFVEAMGELGQPGQPLVADADLEARRHRPASASASGSARSGWRCRSARRCRSACPGSGGRRRAPRPANWRPPARCRCGHGCRGDRRGSTLATSADDRLDLLRQRAAIGVAEHHPARAGVVGGLGAGERIVGIGLVAVEEMLAVEQHLLARLARGRHRLADRIEVLLVRSCRARP